MTQPKTHELRKLLQGRGQGDHAARRQIIRIVYRKLKVGPGPVRCDGRMSKARPGRERVAEKGHAA